MDDYAAKEMAFKASLACTPKTDVGRKFHLLVFGEAAKKAHEWDYFRMRCFHCGISIREAKMTKSKMCGGQRNE